ncbi:MAG: LPXTG cell wall anchor domain-containing protein, partial [Aristaeellaceae bacterium]
GACSSKAPTGPPTATPTATPVPYTPPQTGDHTPVALYAAMLMFSLCGLWLFLRRKPKT